jgi:HEAT repeat protein
MSGWLSRTIGLLAAFLIAGCTPNAKPQDPPTTGLPQLRVAAQNTLAELLTNSDEVVRANALEAMQDAMGTAGRPVFVNSLKDPSPVVRFAAAMAVGRLRIAEAQPLVLPLLTDPDPSVQVAAIFAMHRTGETRYSAGLQTALASPSFQVRADTCLALGRLGENSAIRILRPMLRDPAMEVRLQAAEALWLLGDEQGLAPLVAAGLSSDPSQQMIAILALAEPGNRQIIQHVRAGLSSHYVQVVLVSARALGMLGSDEAYGPALASLGSGDPLERSLAAHAVGAIGQAQSAVPLAPLLKDADANVRVAGALAILELRQSP